MILHEVVVGGRRVGQKGVDVKGLDHLAVANDLDVAKGTEVGGATCRHKGIKGSVHRGNLVRARLKDFTHDVHTDGAAVGQGEGHRIARKRQKV